MPLGIFVKERASVRLTAKRKESRVGSAGLLVELGVLVVVDRGEGQLCVVPRRVTVPIVSAKKNADPNWVGGHR